jgi:hypothetical protein
LPDVPTRLHAALTDRSRLDRRFGECGMATAGESELDARGDLYALGSQQCRVALLAFRG